MIKETFFLSLVILLSGCATKYAYLNTQKPAEEVENDKSGCQAKVDLSDFKDPDLKRNKFNQCMKDKGYNVVSEEEAEKIQGFKELWINPQADFKRYEAAYIDKVDLAQVRINNDVAPDLKISDEDIKRLGEEMLKRFSKALESVIPVIADKDSAQGKKVLYISLKLINICQTNVGLSALLEAAGQFSPVPLPDSPEGDFSFSAEILDYSSREKLATIADGVKGDKNSSLVGAEKFSRWQKSYNVMDYWADKLSGLIAKERHQSYKSQLKMKIF